MIEITTKLLPILEEGLTNKKETFFSDGKDFARNL